MGWLSCFGAGSANDCEPPVNLWFPEIHSTEPCADEVDEVAGNTGAKVPKAIDGMVSLVLFERAIGPPNGQNDQDINGRAIETATTEHLKAFHCEGAVANRGIVRKQRPLYSNARWACVS